MTNSKDDVIQLPDRLPSAREKRAESLRVSAIASEELVLDDSETEDGVLATVSVASPGAVRVEGPRLGTAPIRYVDDDDDTSDEHTFVQAETVDEAAIMQQAENKVVAQAAQAEVLPKKSPWRKRSLYLSVALTVLVAVGIAIGFGVTTSKNGAGSTSSAINREDDLVASVKMIDKESLNFITASKFVSRTRLNESWIISSTANRFLLSSRESYIPMRPKKL